MFYIPDLFFFKNLQQLFVFYYHIKFSSFLIKIQLQVAPGFFFPEKKILRKLPVLVIFWEGQEKEPLQILVHWAQKKANKITVNRKVWVTVELEGELMCTLGKMPNVFLCFTSVRGVYFLYIFNFFFFLNVLQLTFVTNFRNELYFFLIFTARWNNLCS